AATVADLGDCHHVQGVVDPPVPGPGQAVADLVAGGDVDRGGAVIAGEGDQGGDLDAEVLDPGVEGADVGEVVAGDLQADRCDVAGRADAGEQRLGFVRRQLAAHPAERELGQQPVQPADRLGPLRGEFLV